MTDEMSAIYLAQMLNETHEVRVNPIIHFVEIKYSCVFFIFFLYLIIIIIFIIIFFSGGSCCMSRVFKHIIKTNSIS